MALSSTKILSAADALSLVSTFLPLEWKALTSDDIEVKTVAQGFNNCVYIVRRTDAATKSVTSLREPAAVIIRKYGGNVISGTAAKKDLRPVTETQELLIVNSLSHLKLMPRLIGIFDGGRIEEFIACRSMTGQEAVEFLPDIAKNMARVHALSVPMPNPGYNFSEVLWNHWSAFQREYPGIAANEYDFGKELEWMQPLLSHDFHRTVFMNWDPHFGNISLRLDPREDELKVIIFDYEMAGYNMRGKDLGLFLLSLGGLVKTGTFSELEHEFTVADEDLCRRFFDLYLDECELLFPDIDREGMDSYDHLMVESLLGGMVSILCFLFVHIRLAPKFEENESEQFRKTMSDMNVSIRKAFTECKELLHQRFPDYEKILGCSS